METLADSNKTSFDSLEFGEAVKICFKKYGNFKGRASRSEFWWFCLFGGLGGLVTSILDIIFFGPYLQVISTLFIIFMLIPSWAVTARRFHDINKSGWLYLWSFTIIGLIPVFIWMIEKGDHNKNDYGENPLNKKNFKKVVSVKDKVSVEEVASGEKDTLSEEKISKTDADDISNELKKYKQMLTDGLISQADFNAKKKQILGI